ncbi:hypothetical protein N431DRAFT_468241 [Stipitochalara longipes BDJ]|nr:hypothetical protein N431DRAFT_468241 [Stipitochalara longipes BDJ]
MELHDLGRSTGQPNIPEVQDPSSLCRTISKRRSVGHNSSWFSSCWKYSGSWALLFWLVFVAVTVVCWVIYSRLRDSPTEFGLRTRWTAECNKFSNPFQSWRKVALLTVNAVAGVVTAIASYFRTRLLAPTTDDHRIDSWGGFWHVSVLRKLLYILLLLSPLPVYFLSNTLFFVTYPAYNSYEMVVSTSFFDGAPFNLAGVDMTRYDLNEAPTMPPTSLLWPAAYDGVDQLNDSLARLQQDPGLWTNLSRGDCVNEFNAPRYTRYRTLLLVTDFGQPQGQPVNNNSVLAAGILPGYRLASASSSLVALCPEIYLKAYPRATVPNTAPFMPRDALYGELNDFKYVDPAEAEAWASGNASAPKRRSTSFSKSFFRRQLIGGVMATSTVYWDTMPGRDLCYQYWTDAERWAYKPDGTLYMVPRADLSYCVAEPAKPTRLCEAVYSPKVLFVLAITLAIMLGAISIAFLLQLGEEWGYSSAQLPSFDWDSYGSGRWWHQSRTPWQLELLNFVIFIYVWVLWTVARQPNGHKLFATDPRDDGWLINARALYNALHVLYEILFFFQVNNLQKRALAVNGSTTSAGYIILPLRSFLVHFIYGLIFITELQVVMPLEASDGTLDGGKLVSFTTFGISSFNEQSEASWYNFLTFNWAIFVFLPTLWMEVVLWFAIESSEEVGWSLSTLTGCVALPILALVCLIGLAVGNGKSR